MSTKSSVVTVGTTRVSLLPALGNDEQAGSRWSAYNAGDQIVWTGDETVTVGNGIPIPPGGYASEEVGNGDVLYGIAEAPTQLNVKQDGV